MLPKILRRERDGLFRNRSNKYRYEELRPNGDWASFEQLSIDNDDGSQQAPRRYARVFRLEQACIKAFNDLFFKGQYVTVSNFHGSPHLFKLNEFYVDASGALAAISSDGFVYLGRFLNSASHLDLKNQPVGCAKASVCIGDPVAILDGRIVAFSENGIVVVDRNHSLQIITYVRTNGPSEHYAVPYPKSCYELSENETDKIWKSTWKQEAEKCVKTLGVDYCRFEFEDSVLGFTVKTVESSDHKSCTFVGKLIPYVASPLQK